MFVVFNSFGEWHIHDFVVFDTNHHIALVVEKGIDSRSPHARCENAVASRRGASSLQVSENRHTHIISGIFILHTLGKRHSTTCNRTFGHKHN